MTPSGHIPELPDAIHLIAEDRIDSTNAAARRLAGEGAPDGTLVWAREQTGGRGRRGRAWASPRGNLYASFLLRPGTDATTAGQLGFAAALALAEAVETALPPGPCTALKWPNDLLVEDRKAAGILLESVTDAAGHLDAVILGIGLNIAHAPDDTAYPAATLVDAGARADIDAADVLAALAPRMLAWRGTWRARGFAPVRAAWLRRAKGMGEPITVRLPQATLHGTFHDLDPDGALILRQATGVEQRIHVGDVFFASA